jgi:hypothetical protein
MVMYLSIIGGAGFLIALMNGLMRSFEFNYGVLWIIVAVIYSIIVEIAICGFCAAIIEVMPDRWFSNDKKIFQVSKKERRFYEKLHIKAWKDKVFEFGTMGKFRKNKLQDPNNSAYINKFIIESNKGIVIHFAGVVTGFLVMFFLPMKYALGIGLPVYLVGAFLSILPIMILRYNIPKLQAGYERAKRLESRKSNDSN